MGAANSRIIELRKLLAERFAEPAARPTPQIHTGLPALDQLGGLSKGAITEIISPAPSAGSALLIHALLQLARRGRFFLALIDGADSFDLETAASEALAHLFWARCETAAEAIKATDFLLRDGNFPLVILDLVLNSAAELRRIPSTSWYRLQRLVEPSATAFVVLSRYNLVASAQLKISLTSRWSLGDLAREDASDRLEMQVRRAHKAAEAT